MKEMLVMLTNIIKSLQDNKISLQHKYELVFGLGALSFYFIASMLIGGKDSFLSWITMNDIAHDRMALSSLLPLCLRFVTFLLGLVIAVGVLFETTFISNITINHKQIALEMPPSSPFTSIMIGAFIFILMYFSNQIIIYLLLYLSYMIIDIANTTFVGSYVNTKINSIKKQNINLSKEILDEITLYYVKRHRFILWLFRVILILSAITFFILSKRLDISNYENISYSITIFAIVINECFAWSWRSRLYRRSGLLSSTLG